MKLLIASFFALFLTPIQAADFVPVGSARSEIKIDKTHSEECSEYINFVETFTRFTLFKYDWEQKKYYLIKQEFALGQGCFEGYNPQKITVSASTLNPLNGTVAAKPAWQFSTAGVFGAVADYPFTSLYKIDMPGCCAASPVTKYFSLMSGKFIMSSTIRPLLLDLIEQRTQRYIAVEDNTAAARWGDADNKVENIATIFLGNNSGNLQSVSIRSTDATFNHDDWMVTQLNFVGKDANEFVNSLFKNSDLAGLALNIVLTCRCERPELTIVVPMDANRLDTKHATSAGTNTLVLENIIAPTAAAH